MPVPAKRFSFLNQDTNVGILDFTDISGNDIYNIDSNTFAELSTLLNSIQDQLTNAISESGVLDIIDNILAELPIGDIMSDILSTLKDVFGDLGIINSLLSGLSEECLRDIYRFAGNCDPNLGNFPNIGINPCPPGAIDSLFGNIGLNIDSQATSVIRYGNGVVSSVADCKRNAILAGLISYSSNPESVLSALSGVLDPADLVIITDLVNLNTSGQEPYDLFDPTDPIYDEGTTSPVRVTGPTAIVAGTEATFTISNFDSSLKYFVELIYEGTTEIYKSFNVMSSSFVVSAPTEPVNLILRITVAGYMDFIFTIKVISATDTTTIIINGPLIVEPNSKTKYTIDNYDSTEVYIAETTEGSIEQGSGYFIYTSTANPGTADISVYKQSTPENKTTITVNIADESKPLSDGCLPNSSSGMQLLDHRVIGALKSEETNILYLTYEIYYVFKFSDSVDATKLKDKAPIFFKFDNETPRPIKEDGGLVELYVNENIVTYFYRFAIMASAGGSFESRFIWEHQFSSIRGKNITYSGTADKIYGKSGAVCAQFDIDFEPWDAKIIPFASDDYNKNIQDAKDAYNSYVSANQITSSTSVVTNNTSTTTPPKLVSAIMNKEDFIIGLTFDKELDSSSIPSFNSFGTEREIVNVKVNSKFVVLYLASPVADYNNVAISYTKSTGSILKSKDGTPVESFNSLVEPAFKDELNDPIGSFIKTYQYYSGNKVYIIYDRAINPASLPAVYNYKIKTDWDEILTNASLIEFNANIVIVTFPINIPPNLNIYFEYKIFSSYPPYLEDMKGNISEYILMNQPEGPNTTDVPPSSTPTSTTTPPKLVSAILNKENFVIGLTFDKELNKSSVPDISSFTTSVPVGEITINNKFVTLTLTQTLPDPSNASISYTPPASNKLTGFSGNSVTSFTSPVKPSANANTSSFIPVYVYYSGNQVFIISDRILNPTARPNPTDIAISLDPSLPITYQNGTGSTSFSINNNLITINFPITIPPNKTIRFQYEVYSSIPPFLEDLNGNLLEFIYNNNVTDVPPSSTPTPTTPISPIINNCTSTTTPPPIYNNGQPPKLVSAIMNKEDFIIGLTFDKELNKSSVPDISSFATGATITELRINSKFVTIMVNPVFPDPSNVSITYTPPASNKLTDSFGNSVVAFSSIVQPSANVAASSFKELDTYHSGDKVYIVYDRILNPFANPSVYNFTFWADNPQRVIGSIRSEILNNIVVVTFANVFNPSSTINFKYEVFSSMPPFLEDLNGNTADYIEFKPITNKPKTVTPPPSTGVTYPLPDGEYNGLATPENPLFGEPDCPNIVKTELNTSTNILSITFDKILDPEQEPTAYGIQLACYPKYDPAVHPALAYLAPGQEFILSDSAADVWFEGHIVKAFYKFNTYYAVNVRTPRPGDVVYFLWIPYGSFPPFFQDRFGRAASFRDRAASVPITYTNG